MAFYTYMLRCSDGRYYTGHTEDLEIRVTQHQSGEFGGWTSKHRPVELVWSEAFPSRYEALAAERQIKNWSQAKKEALIRGDWEGVSAAGKKRFTAETLPRYAVSTSSTATRDERLMGIILP